MKFKVPDPWRFHNFAAPFPVLTHSRGKAREMCDRKAERWIVVHYPSWLVYIEERKKGNKETGKKWKKNIELWQARATIQRALKGKFGVT